MLLETKDLTKRFGGLTAVSRMTLQVRTGEIRGIIGPNGSGKSTFFNLISGVYKPDAGSVTFDGEVLLFIYFRIYFLVSLFSSIYLTLSTHCLL